MRRLILGCFVLLGVAVGLIAAGEKGWGPVVVTREGEQKLVLLLGNPQEPFVEPGVRLRWPFVSRVLTFDKRALFLGTKGEPIQTKDHERIVVDNYVVWKIKDPRLFYASFPEASAAEGLIAASSQIERVVRADVRSVIGQRTLEEVLTTAREEIMQQIAKESDEMLGKLGIAVEDVRINKTELPAGTERNVFERMTAERQRLARKNRAEGEERGQSIRAQAERESQVMVAEAQRDAEIVRAAGDAEATRIYAEAYSRDSEFYSFMRTLQAYRKTIGEKTTLLLSPEHGFFRLFGGDSKTPRSRAPEGTP